MKSREFQKLIKLFKLDAWDIKLSECKERPTWVGLDASAQVNFDSARRTCIIWSPVGKKQRAGIIHELLHIVFADAFMDDIPDNNEHRVICLLEDILAKYL